VIVPDSTVLTIRYNGEAVKVDTSFRPRARAFLPNSGAGLRRVARPYDDRPRERHRFEADLNAAPTAAFAFAPASPSTADTVTFTSTSTAPEGRLAAQAWDLDGDGALDDVPAGGGLSAGGGLLAGGESAESTNARERLDDATRKLAALDRHLARESRRPLKWYRKLNRRGWPAAQVRRYDRALRKFNQDRRRRRGLVKRVDALGELVDRLC
jgi:hypothetical protein